MAILALMSYALIFDLPIENIGICEGIAVGMIALLSIVVFLEVSQHIPIIYLHVSQTSVAVMEVRRNNEWRGANESYKDLIMWANPCYIIV